MKNISLTTLAILLFLLVAALPASAQNDPAPEPEEVPLDPLSWTLLGAGGAAAAKKYISKRKQAK
jgi:hypothetical protein